MTPVPRKKNKHLPPKVHYKGGAYYYVYDVYENGKRKRIWEGLGKEFHKAMSKWSELVNAPLLAKNMGAIFDRYMLEVAPHKKSYKQYIYMMATLRSGFSDMQIDEITPVDIYRYMDERGKDGKIAANREKTLLSHVFAMAIRWGLASDNPCRLVKRFPEKGRKRYVTDEEYEAVKKLAPPIVRCTMELAYLTGQRLGDVLKIHLSDCTDEGILFVQNKTEAKLLVEWSGELQEAVQRAKKIKRTIRGFYLIASHKGQPYTAQGFKCMWQRVMNKAIAKGLIKERFTFHDLRRKAATDKEKREGREKARQFLGHATQQMTGRYISGVQRVNPVK